MNKKMLYTVNQTQPEAEYQDTTIAIFSNKQDAISLARKLNQEYGSGCVFNDVWDFVEYNMQDNPHFYTVDCVELDPEQEKYL